MGRIPGYYEWDDDDLTPGRKKEGGLHQNLFDADGILKGSAQFIPADEVDSDPALWSGCMLRTRLLVLLALPCRVGRCKT